MTNQLPKPGSAHSWALDAYLRGARAAPKRGVFIVHILHQLCEARAGAYPLHPQQADAAVAYHGDEILAWAWYSAHRICHGVADVRGSYREAEGEHTARVQMHALFARCREHIDFLEGRAGFWAHEDAEALAVLHDYRLLGGVVALCLAEADDRQARAYVRSEAAVLLSESGDVAYVPAVLGLARQPTEGWRAGQGSLGWLASALREGDGLCRARASLERIEARTEEDRAKGLRAVKALGERSKSESKPEPAQPPVAAGQTLVVFPNLDHLPGKRPDGNHGVRSFTAQNPLSEHGHLAERPLPLSPAPDLRVVVEALNREFPWYRDVTRTLAADLGRGRYARVRHTLLHGPPGSAKTRYARRFLELAGLPVLVYPAAGTSDAAFGGTSRQWSTGRLSVPAGLIARVQRANCGIVLDEADKLPPPGSGHNGRLDEVLLPYLEPESARAVHDLYVEAPLDLSAVSYLATANDLTRVPAPLRDRFRVIEAPLPRPEDLPAIARSMTAEILSEQGLDPAWAEPLAQDELDLLAERWRGGSLRGLRRMVEVLLDGRPAGRVQ